MRRGARLKELEGKRRFPCVRGSRGWGDAEGFVEEVKSGCRPRWKEAGAGHLHWRLSSKYSPSHLFSLELGGDCDGILTVSNLTSEVGDILLPILSPLLIEGRVAVLLVDWVTGLIFKIHKDEIDRKKDLNLLTQYHHAD